MATATHRPAWVAVPARDEEHHLGDALAALDVAAREVRGEVHLVAVDDSSTDRTPAPHGIPRSVVVPAVSPGTGGSWWIPIAGVLWAVLIGWYVPQAPHFDAIWWFVIFGFFRGGLRPQRRVAKLVDEMGIVIAEMNAELDRRRGAGKTAALLEAAHPAFRKIPYDD